MSLEKILTALEFSMNDRLDEIGDDLLSVEGVEDALITYSLEKEVRPELVEVIKLKGVMNNYLNLSLEDREGVDKFREDNLGYLEGEGKEKRFSREMSGGVYRFVREQRWVPSLLEFFDFYLDNRTDGQIFGCNYLQTNERLKQQFGSKPRNLYENARIYFSESGRLDHLLDLAIQSCPELEKYTTGVSLLEVDGTRELITYFDFYLENRAPGEIFGSTYFQRNKKLIKQFCSKPKNLCQNAKNNFSDSGSLRHLIDLAIKVRPDLKQYTTFKGLLEIDGPRELLSYFDFYLGNRVDGEIFGPNYLQVNEKLKKEFSSKPKNLYANARNNFSENGRIDHIVRLASKERPEILDHWRNGALKSNGGYEA